MPRGRFRGHARGAWSPGCSSNSDDGGVRRGVKVLEGLRGPLSLLEVLGGLGQTLFEHARHLRSGRSLRSGFEPGLQVPKRGHRIGAYGWVEDVEGNGIPVAREALLDERASI